MLIDPENPYENWETEIRAKNLGDAEFQCEQAIPTDQLVELLQVTQETKTPGKDGRFKFVCWYRREISS
jgi:hypothetical protein